MHVSDGSLPIKKTLLYKERDEKLRQEFQERIQFIAKDHLVFIDESGIDSFVSRHFGRAPRGEKIQGEIYFRTLEQAIVFAFKIVPFLI